MSLSQAIAILFLVLVALSRSLIFIWPAQARKFFQKIAQTHSDGFRYLALVLFLVSLTALYGISSELSVAQIIAAAFAVAMLLGSWFMWHSEFYQAILSILIKKEDGWIRVHAGLSVLLALLLLYVILTS